MTLGTSERQVRNAIDVLRDKRIRSNGGDLGEWDIIGQKKFETILSLGNRTQPNTHLYGKCHIRCRSQFKGVEQDQKKKMRKNLANSKGMITFALDDES